MKRKSFIYLFVLLIIFVPFHNNFVSGQGKYIKVMYDNVNVRSGPSTEYNILNQAHNEEMYPFLEESGEWIKIDLNGQIGWISSQFVEVIVDDENAEEVVSNYTITIEMDKTHLREQPSVDSKIIFFANKGEVLTVLGQVGDWLKVQKDEEVGYLYKNFIENKTTVETNVLKGKKIVIDPGHGGYDVGAISVSGQYEKDFTYTTANLLKNVLTSLGADVYMTRYQDEFIRLGSRVSLANLVQADLFISIHYNSFPEYPSAQGISTYYYDEKDKQLAETIQENLILSTQAQNRDALQENYLVLRHNNSRALLLELGFLSNKEEEARLLSSEYQKRLVEGMVNGFIEYLTNQK